MLARPAPGRRTASAVGETFDQQSARRCPSARATRRKVVTVLAAFLVSFLVVFVAELGDKSQLMTITYALRYRWWVVLGGVGVAAFLVHGISVTVGHFLGLALPQRPIAFAAAAAFLLFAAWTWRERPEDGVDPAELAAPATRHVLFAVVSSFVLAELGDKTMLATVALASERPWAGVWLGATAGMVLADGVAVAVGAVLHRRLPQRLLHGLAALLFAVFGLWLLFDGALHLRWAAVAAVAAALVAAAAVAALGRRRRQSGLGRRRRRSGPAGDPALRPTDARAAEH